ncbi:MAG: EutN/CcmL family microcompartment protein [Deltaproteobacteria bacterium]|jgi:ethanolamine utilization protein EutN|nr:EutN/CcmL family microcompartment protein [Deltaproteobacteria bacterium]MDR1297620.1 EutN/CcmL family microcompartment protein [Deltaproteobacteria bacterium]
MIIAKVIGTVWATKKVPTLEGWKLLVVRTTSSGGPETLVAADQIGAGVGEDVLITKGSVSRAAVQGPPSPIDAVVVGIIDSLEVERGLLE